MSIAPASARAPAGDFIDGTDERGQPARVWVPLSSNRRADGVTPPAGTAADPTSTNSAATPSSAAGNAITPTVGTNTASLLVKNAPGNFYSAVVVNNAASASAGYLIAYNAAAVPANGAGLTANLILAAADVAAGARGSIDPNIVPDRFSVGIVILFSTSLATFTPPAVLPVFLKGRGV